MIGAGCQPFLGYLHLLFIVRITPKLAVVVKAGLRIFSVFIAEVQQFLQMILDEVCPDAEILTFECLSALITQVSGILPCLHVRSASPVVFCGIHIEIIVVLFKTESPVQIPYRAEMDKAVGVQHVTTEVICALGVHELVIDH